MNNQTLLDLHALISKLNHPHASQLTIRKCLKGNLILRLEVGLHGKVYTYAKSFPKTLLEDAQVDVSEYFILEANACIEKELRKERK